MHTHVGLALAGLAALLTLLVVLTAVRKSLRTAAARRRECVEAAVRPRLIEWLAAERTGATTLSEARGTDGRILDSVTASLLTKLRGVDRDAIVELLEVRGVISSACRATRSRGAVRRARAAELLGAAATSSSFTDLQRLLGDGNSEVRAVAARAFGRLGRAEAVQPLLEALDGQSPLPVGLVTMAWLHVGAVAEEPLRFVGLRSASPLTRSVSARLLGVLGAVGSEADLVGVAESDPDPQAREAAAFALGRVGGPKAIRALIRCLEENAFAPLTTAAARALGEIGGVQAVPALETAASSPIHTVARAATVALAGLGAEGWSRLEMLAHGTGMAAEHAREAISTASIAQRSGQRAA